MNSLENFLHSERFIVLGGHKCGTSSLHAYLDQHPEIAMPQTKGQDILNRYNLSIEDYMNSYKRTANYKIFGEVSSAYLQSKVADLAIEKYFPNAKLIVILRHPSERAFSHFNFLPQNQTANFQFRELCQKPEKFINSPIREVIANGLYYSNLKRYYDRFGGQKIHILLFDDLIKDKNKFFMSLFKFIEVRADFVPDTSFIVRKGGKVKNEKLQKLIFSNNVWLSRIKSLIKPLTTPQQRYHLDKKIKQHFISKESLPNHLKASLTNFYREDILKTQDLIGISLSHWLKDS